VNQLSTLAYTIWVDYMNKSSDTDTVRIASWIIANIGKLNILINTSFSIQDNTFYPLIGDQEAAILGNMYIAKYADDLAFKAVRGIISYENGSISSAWISMKDEESSITRANPNETSKIFTSMAKEARDKVKELVDNYKYNISTPSDVGRC